MNDVPVALGGPCIFCAGQAVATTEDHCPPKSMFRDKQWPVGYVFPACFACNGGASDDDLMLAFMAQMDPGATNERKMKGLMYLLHRQNPEALPAMELSAVEARAGARRLGLRPDPGQTYQEIGIVRVPDAMDEAVATLATKLSKAVYFSHSGKVFPTDGGIMMSWFSNASRLENAGGTVLDALTGLAAMSTPKTRNGKDLQDQFDYRYSQGEDHDLNVLQAVFGPVFGFVTLFSPTPGKMEGFEASLKAKHGRQRSPFIWLGSNRPEVAAPTSCAPAPKRRIALRPFPLLAWAPIRAPEPNSQVVGP